MKKRLSEKRVAGRPHHLSLTSRLGPGPAEHSLLLLWRTHWTTDTQNHVWGSGRPERGATAGISPLPEGYRGRGCGRGQRGPTSKRMAPFPSASKALKRKCA